MDKITKVISAYPCCGKTYIVENQRKLFDDPNLVILDSDSSKFSWIREKRPDGEKKRNPDFPNNYIQHIKENIGKADFIFVSSHKVVREALAEAGIKFTIVVPHKNLLTDWMIKMYDRGNDDEFINTQINNWDKWLTEIDDEKNTYAKKIVLKNRQTLYDVLFDC